VFRVIFVFLFSSAVFAVTSTDVEKYLNEIKTLKANFIQEDLTNKVLAEGILHLSRPGKLRIEYTNPFQSAIFANGGVTTYYDKELDEVSNIPTSSTPLHFLLGDKVAFDENIKIKDFKETKEEITILLYETEKQEQGTLILIFTKPLTLKEIRIINELGQEISMSFFDTEFNKPINNSIYNFINPRFKRKI
jgi:outer membrane lipoprotein-sorting protein